MTTMPLWKRKQCGHSRRDAEHHRAQWLAAAVQLDAFVTALRAEIEQKPGGDRDDTPPGPVR